MLTGFLPTLTGGVVFTGASVPIPALRAVGVPPAAVSKTGWEIALSRSLPIGRKNGVRPK